MNDATRVVWFLVAGLIVIVLADYFPTLINGLLVIILGGVILKNSDVWVPLLQTINGGQQSGQQSK